MRWWWDNDIDKRGKREATKKEHDYAIKTDTITIYMQYPYTEGTWAYIQDLPHNSMYM